MNSTMRNLTLTAAALAALTVVAPTAAADDRGRGRRDSRQEYRGHERNEGRRHGYGGYGARGREYVTPRHVGRYGHRYGYAAPYRHFSGFRFYPAYPGAGYVYIAGFGWVLPPFFGAVWVPAHYDYRGFWIEGYWR